MSLNLNLAQDVAQLCSNILYLPIILKRFIKILTSKQSEHLRELDWLRIMLKTKKTFSNKSKIRALYKNIRKFMERGFESDLLEAAIKNILKCDKRININVFSVVMRELLRNVFERISPDDKIMCCSWYERKLKDKKIYASHADRITYSIIGGISKEILDELEVSIDDHVKSINSMYNSLSKYTHVSKKTFDIPKNQQLILIIDILKNIKKQFEHIDKIKLALNSALEDFVYNEILNGVLSDQIQSIDELATHYLVDDINVENINVFEISDAKIYMAVDGEISVRIQYGSDSDVRNDNGVRFYDSFPFDTILDISTDDLSDINFDIEKFSVNTRSFLQLDFDLKQYNLNCLKIVLIII